MRGTTRHSFQIFGPEILLMKRSQRQSDQAAT